MKKGLFLAVVTIAVLVVSALPLWGTAISLGGGYELSNLYFMEVIVETPVGELVGLRATMSFSLNQDIAGLTLATGGAFIHQPFAPLDPFLGAGIGVALTPPGYSLGFLVQGIAGSHIALFEPLAAFIDVRYIVRFTAAGTSFGPLFEAGLSLMF